MEEAKVDVDRPVDLGFTIWETVQVPLLFMQDRYYETNKISTDDPDVLYDFYVHQKKTVRNYLFS